MFWPERCILKRMKKHGAKAEEKGIDVEAAARVRDACVKVALNAYENARMDGLCQEGAWEAAVSAMRMLDVDKIVEE